MHTLTIKNNSLRLPPEILDQMNLEEGQQVVLRPIDETRFEIDVIPVSRDLLNQRLKEECEELAQLDLSDAGDEETWLILGNEALGLAEQAIEKKP